MLNLHCNNNDKKKKHKKIIKTRTVRKSDYTPAVVLGIYMALLRKQNVK